MSIQAGIWNTDGAPVHHDDLHRISQACAEYGSDGEAFYACTDNRNIEMLFRPLHTSTESSSEKQPYRCERTRVLTWDGRLDNREELISELKDSLTEDRTDVAIVGAALERWGFKGFRRIVGDWALVIWDPSAREVVLARDYIGVRTLFYRHEPGTIRWCSHLAPLLVAGKPLTLCEEYVADYLVSHFQGHLTPYHEISAVPPGSFVTIRNDSIFTTRYWEFCPDVQIRHKNDAEYEDHFLHLFRQALRRRLRSQSAILAELSGGFDSSSIVCVADGILDSDAGTARRLETFSFNYLDEPEGNDSQYITAIEERRGQTGEHAQIQGTGDSFPLAPGAFRAVPFMGPRSEVSMARTHGVRKGNFRISLSGFGGDEFLGQTLEGRVQLATFLAKFQIREFARQLMAWSLFWRFPLIQLAIQSGRLLLPVALRGYTSEVMKVGTWMNPNFVRRHQLNIRVLSAAEGAWWWSPSARDWFQTHARIAGILTNLQPTADERRYPFLDQTLTEFLMAIPTDQLLRPGERRSLMRRALAGILPEKIGSRRTKQLEGRGYIITLRKHWELIQGILELPISARLGYINRQDFAAALTGLRNGQLFKESMMVLRGLFLELWLRGAIEQSVISVPELA